MVPVLLNVSDPPPEPEASIVAVFALLEASPIVNRRLVVCVVLPVYCRVPPLKIVCDALVAAVIEVLLVPPAVPIDELLPTFASEATLRIPPSIVVRFE